MNDINVINMPYDFMGLILEDSNILFQIKCMIGSNEILKRSGGEIGDVIQMDIDTYNQIKELIKRMEDKRYE